ncbi:hypothetical protein KZG85_002831 [Vibrio cholerae]|nr:capsular biosynthesis protein [Vibrio cholerae]EHU6506329.1 hypothetical protein [Vibrio cholerae]EKF9161325.1 hypothetical protein [Vibrio cholerae]ELT6289206.1 hypothetical protein [Vibrio cholerae]
MNAKKISVIIPLRLNPGVYQANERLLRISETVPRDKFDIIIVDYGTAEPYRGILSELENVNIVRVDNEDKPFSIGGARDIGVQHSSNDIAIFHDIDFLGDKDTYNRIYNEVCTRNMWENGYEFFCIPVFFLTENGTSEYLSDINNFSFHSKILRCEKDIVQFPAYGSSAIVVNKWHYLAIGGHSKQFFGHGAEDYDVLHRLSSYSPKGPRTVDYYHNTKSNDINKYVGFRAFFALYGIDVFYKSIYFVHLWHPTRKIKGYHQTARNFAILSTLMRDFDRNRSQPMPLVDKVNNVRTLIIMDPSSSVFKSIRHAIPLFGDYTVLSEDLFERPSDLINFLDEKNIDNILILNPYGNERRLGLYNLLKETNKNTIVFDRGALPDSWFFDTGFNYDSKTFLPICWDVPLSDDSILNVIGYINELTSGEDSLEESSQRKTADYYREKYQVGKRKVLFVPFQRPSDSVIKYFSGKVENVRVFSEWVKFLVEKLDKKEWVVLYKKHPLESGVSSIDGAIRVEDDAHINDLIDLSDRIFLINSGVGCLGLAFNRKVICAGQSFYAGNGLAVSVETKEEALYEILNKSNEPNKEKVYRFYHHLINNVYSFGKSYYKDVPSDSGNKVKIVNRIDFYQIVVLGRKVNLGRPYPGVSLDAPIFYSFGGRQGIKSEIEKSKSNNLKQSKPLVKSVIKTNEIKLEEKKVNWLTLKSKRWVNNPKLLVSDTMRKMKKIKMVNG